MTKADEPKPTGAKTDPGDTSGKKVDQDPAPANSGNSSFSKDDVDKARQDGFDAGSAKAAEKAATDAEGAFLKSLGFDSVDDLKASIAAGKAAVDKLNESKDPTEKRFDEIERKHAEELAAIRKEGEDKLKAYQGQVDPILDKALEAIERANRMEAIDKLNIADEEMLDDLMKAVPAEEGEPFFDHAKRVVEAKKGKYPGLVHAEDGPRHYPASTPTPQSDDMASRIAAKIQRVSQLSGAPQQ